MSGDYSRWSFDPSRHFSGVLMQQGRVQTDADWNEWVTTIQRRVQAEALDTLGRAVVPRETPNGFRIDASGGTFTIGVGRIYVDGLLAENHGVGSLEWDPRLAETRGTEATPYRQQRYAPYLLASDAPPLPGGGLHLVYLKVWQREISAVEDPLLVEKALGADTTTRLQTAWQVKVLPNVGSEVTCVTPLDALPGFAVAEPAASGRLWTDTAEVPGEPDPCLVPPSGGYKGLENQLYRVEIHRGGDFNGDDRATFKWSRDNATVASRVTAIPAPGRIVVESVGRDALLRFSDGDWIEITDDWRELAGLPGEMRQIRSGGGVDDATRSILFEPPLPDGAFPVGADGSTTPARNTRVRRWDQGGRVLDAAGNLLIDLGVAESGGTIPVPSSGTSVLLENGIVVAFGLEPAEGRFRTGDHWLFAARTADASIEILDRAPPRGIHAHYAKLAIVTFLETETDCRVLWPPETRTEAGCDCTVCVSAESHAEGSLTIQTAIHLVAETGGTVCLGPGAYAISEPVRVKDARRVRIRGQGRASILAASGGDGGIEVDNSRNVIIENLAVLTAAPAAVTLRNTYDVTLQRMRVFNRGSPKQTSVAIKIDAGYAFYTRIERCLLEAAIGIQGGDGRLLITFGLRIADNTLLCVDRGVSLEQRAIHVSDTHVKDNTIQARSGILVIGGVIPQGTFDIANNLLRVAASGIVAGTDGLRIAENDIGAPPGQLAGAGIALVRGLDSTGIDHAQILANRVHGIRGHGIAIRTRVNSGMIKMNVIAQVTGGGIVMELDAEVGALVVENNQLLGVGLRGNGRDPIAAMRFMGARELDVCANTISGFAREARESESRTAILAVASERVRIVGNSITGLAPVDAAGQTTGIEVIAPFREAVISGNTVRRRGEDADSLTAAQWVGIGARGGVDSATPSDSLGFIQLGDIALGWNTDSSYLFTGSTLRASAAPAAGDVALRGNEVESELSTSAPLVVDAAGGCLIVDNRIALLPFEKTDSAPAPSRVKARRAIVSSNDLRGPSGHNVLSVQVTGPDQAAIVGNLCSGGIVLNSRSLEDPWAALNPISRE